MSTPEEDAAAISAAVLAALQGPKRVRGDAGEVEMHSVGDLIQIDKYYKGKAAVANPHRGIRFTQLKPPGTT